MATAIYPNVAALRLIPVITAVFATAKLKLYKTLTTITKNLVLANLTEADFSGYAAVTLTAVGAPYLAPSGGAKFDIATVQWTFDGTIDPPVTNEVYGFWIEDSTGKLLMVGAFNNAQSMAAAGDAIPLTCVFEFFANDVINYLVGTELQ